MMRLTFLISLMTLTYSADALGTIDVIVKTPECVVFASDSRTTNAVTEEIVSDSYEKIVKISHFVMAQTAGAATPGNKNLKTTIQHFKWLYDISDSSHIFIDSLVELFRMYCRDQQSLGVDYSGFLISFAGADSTGRIRLCDYAPSLNKLVFDDGYSVTWRGIRNVGQRIIKGIDYNMKDAISNLVRESIPESSSDSIMSQLNEIFDNFEIIQSQILSWSLQDAIDYAFMLVNTTIIVDRMSLGKYGRDQQAVNPKTGGRILLCVATREGVKWIRMPKHMMDEAQPGH